MSIIYTETFLINSLDLPSYLAAQKDFFPKFYWKCKKTGEERAAFGSLFSCLDIPHSTEDPSLCFYGTLSFPSKSTDQKNSFLWKDFPSTFFFLPKYEIRQSNILGKTELIYRSYTPITQKEVFSCLKPTQEIPLPPPLNNRVDSPSQNSWTKEIIPSVLQTIHQESSSLKKIVMARKTSFSFDSTFSSFSWLKKILLLCPSTETFAIQLAPSSLFLGSSPERLYWRKQNTIYTEAIAGTEARANDTKRDQILAQNLLQDKKCGLEIEYVRQFLASQLAHLCDEAGLESSNASNIVKTDTVQHLIQQFSGTLKTENVSDSILINRLHPTPAVNGFPGKKALDLIPTIEPFDRGLYAGVVGWFSQENASFTVAIRSALVEDGLLHAFAGAGIVKGSIPAEEWTELDQKIQHWVT